MHKKEPDNELKVTVAYARYGHGMRYYTRRSERDIPYSKALIRAQIIPSITFWDIVVAKRMTIGAGMQAGAATISTAGASVLASSEYAVDTLVDGKSHTEASSNLNKKRK